MKAPGFWYRPPGMAAALLAPLGALYAAGARRRLAGGAGQRVGVPVLCVGNLVAGGAGKTPVALTLAATLRSRGRQPHFLSRGYGGALSGAAPVRVDPTRHTAAEVGDEPLLLAEQAPAWICRDRVAGALAAANAGADVVILDDGYQNPALAHDLALLVVDGGAGFGNGRVIPAGPLREALADGLARADAVMIIGDDSAGATTTLATHAPSLPRLTARLEPDPAVAARLAGRPAIAFAGIGRPGKFFDTCAAIGVRLVETVAFPDHHPYTATELDTLIRRADTRGAALLTTRKDWTRVPPMLQDRVTAVPVSLRVDDPGALAGLLARLPS